PRVSTAAPPWGQHRPAPRSIPGNAPRPSDSSARSKVHPSAFAACAAHCYGHGPVRGASMPNAIFDADSHVMEVDEWLPGYADPDVRERLVPLGLANAGAGARDLMASLPGVWA